MEAASFSLQQGQKESKNRSYLGIVIRRVVIIITNNKQSGTIIMNNHNWPLCRVLENNNQSLAR